MTRTKKAANAGGNPQRIQAALERRRSSSAGLHRGRNDSRRACSRNARKQRAIADSRED